MSETDPFEISRSLNICKKEKFPQKSICPRCYYEDDGSANQRTVMRYLYGVYTEEKLLVWKCFLILNVSFAPINTCLQLKYQGKMIA